jgi:hypothetical protein
LKINCTCPTLSHPAIPPLISSHHTNPHFKSSLSLQEMKHSAGTTIYASIAIHPPLTTLCFYWQKSEGLTRVSLMYVWH